MLIVAGFILLNAEKYQNDADAKVYYLAGRLLTSGNINKIYDISYQERANDQFFVQVKSAILFINTPAAALVFAPLTFLSFYHFYVIQVILSTLLIGFSVFLLCRKLDIKSEYCIALVIFLPVLSAISHAQITALIFLFYVLSIINFKKPLVSGFFAGLLFLKPQHLLFVPLLFLIVKSREDKLKFLKGFALSFFTLVLINVFIYGSTVFTDYYNFMIGSRNKLLVQAEMYEGYNLRAAATFLDPLLGYATSSALLSAVELILYTAALLAVTASKHWKNAISAAVIFALALNIHTKYIDLLILIIPIILLLSTLKFDLLPKKIPQRIDQLKKLFVVIVLLCFPITNFAANYALSAVLLVFCAFWICTVQD